MTAGAWIGGKGSRITYIGCLARKICVVMGMGSDASWLASVLSKNGAIVRHRRVTPHLNTRYDSDLNPFDEEALREAVRGADFVFYFGKVFFSNWPSRTVWQYNVDSVRMVCLAAEAEGVRRMVYCGSILSLGRQTSEAPVDASTPYLSDDARTTVERSLFRGEMEVWRAAERGLPVTVVLAGLRQGLVCEHLKHFMRRGGTTMPPMESAFIDIDDLTEALIDASDDAHIGERIVCAGRNASIATLAGEVAARMRRKGIHMPFKIKVLTDWQMRILLKMPRWVASRWLFAPAMGRLLTRRDRYA